MGANQLMYHIRDGFRSIFTHGLMSFASVCMILACLLIMGSFSLVAVNVSHMLQELEDENEFLAFVDENYTEDEARALQSRLESITNVSSVTFTTRAEAKSNFIGTQENQNMFTDVPNETFRDRFHIHVVDIEQMADTVEQVKQVPGIADTKESLEIANGFVMLRNVASGVAIIMIVTLVVVSVFIISNTVRISTFTRREEIAVLRMCGASNWFIRGPFLVEGVILGLTGGIIAFAAQWGIYGLIQNSMENSGILEIISAVPFSDMAVMILAVFLGAGFAIGAGGSTIAIGKFLKI